MSSEFEHPFLIFSYWRNKIYSTQNCIEITNLITGEIINTQLGEDVTKYFPHKPPIIDNIKVEMKAKYCRT